MHYGIIKNAMLAIAMLLSASLSTGADKPAANPSHAVEPVMGGIEPIVKQYAGVSKPAKIPAAKRVDVNTASKAALMKLPGIGEEEADKIIAGRPYLTRYGLVSQKSIPMGTYQGIRKLVIVKQPANDGDKKAVPAVLKK